MGYSLLLTNTGAKRLDFNKARTFVEVVDRGGITAAATRLKRTQQAISAQINSLESDLGIPLLVRQGPNITLTADGERLYKLFKDHLVSIEGGVQQLKTDKTNASGVIRIGSWLEVSTHYLPKIISGFSKKFPLVDFDIRNAADDELESMVMDNTIDVSFQIFTQQQRLLKKSPALNAVFVPVVSKDYVSKQGLPKTIETTLDIPVIDYPAKYSQYDHWIKKNENNLGSLGRKKSPLVQAPSNVILKQLVREGMGMGFLIQSSIQEELDSGELIALTFPSNPEPNWVEIDIVYKRQNSLGFIHKEFIQYVIENREPPEFLGKHRRNPPHN